MLSSVEDDEPANTVASTPTSAATVVATCFHLGSWLTQADPLTAD